MAGNIATKLFKGGMNKDVDISIIGEDTYSHAENFKLIANSDSNSFILENAEGNKAFIDLTTISGVEDEHRIVGYCFINPHLVIFMSENTDTRTIDPAKESIIVDVYIDKDKYQSGKVIYTDTTGDRLDFNAAFPISAVGTYETDDIIKVYWTDGYNPVRFMNIVDPDIQDNPVGNFELLPPFVYDTTSSGRVSFIEFVGGSLTCSVIQYAYQYYNKNGQSTVISAVSPTIAVIPGDDSPQQVRYLSGGELNEESGKGIKVTIPIAQGIVYDGVRLIALDYDTYNDLPNIRITREIDLNKDDYASAPGTLSVIDTGSTINEYTYDEFLILSRKNIVAKTLDIKDNRLFLGNIREEIFDVTFDARAYRFNTSRNAEIYMATDTAYASPTVVTNANWSSVSETHDCINPYNDPAKEESEIFVLQNDGATYGAEGPNVEIKLVTTDTPSGGTGSNYSVFYIHMGDVVNVNNPNDLVEARNFKRQEIYRLGITFQNERGVDSPVKWSCDLKMPNQYDYDGTHYTSDYKLFNTIGGYPYFRRLGIEVTLKSALPAGATSWQVVMVPRGTSDRSIVATGMVQTPRSTGGGIRLEHYAEPTTVEDYFVLNSGTDSFISLTSPELQYNKKLNKQNDDFINIVGLYSYTKLTDHTIYDKVLQSKLKSITVSNVTSIDSSTKINVEELLFTPYSTNWTQDYVIGPYEYRNYVSINNATDTAAHQGYGGSKLNIYSEDIFTSITATQNDYVIMASYRRGVTSNLFGGNSYYDRQYNEYIGISDLCFSASSVTTYEGDTVIEWYDYMNSFIHEDASINASASSIIFPTETSIVTGLSLDKPWYKVFDNLSAQLMQEIAGSYSGTIGGNAVTYIQDKDLYTYNSVYSKWYGGKYFLPKLINSNDNTVFNNRIISSELKTVGELEDSMSIFKTNNYLDLDGSKGSLNKIVNFKNQLYFWQDTGFGIASVNSRSLITDNNPGALALGTGGILNRYDYIEDNIGSTNEQGIVPSLTSLYWVDNNKNEIYNYNGKSNSLSKLKGLQTWIRENGQLGHVIGVYDKKYNDVIFTMSFARVAEVVDTSGSNAVGFEFNDNTDLVTTNSYVVKVYAEYDSDVRLPRTNVMSYSSGPGYWVLEEEVLGKLGTDFYITIENDPTYTYTVNYNESLNVFTSFASFTPYQYLSLNKTYLTSNNKYGLFIHNDVDAPRSSYYAVTYPSVVTVPFNKDFAYTKTFDTLKWVSESVDANGVNQFKDTINVIEIWNDYQYTGNKVTYYQGDDAPVGTTYNPLPITRRERTWSTSIPRSIVDENVSNNLNIFTNVNETQLYKERIRNKYMMVKLTYNNTDGNTFSMPFLSTIYRKSYR